MTCWGRLEVILKSSPGYLEFMVPYSEIALVTSGSLGDHRAWSPRHPSHLGPYWAYPRAMSALRPDPEGATGSSWGRPEVTFVPVRGRRGTILGPGGRLGILFGLSGGPPRFQGNFRYA